MATLLANLFYLSFAVTLLVVSFILVCIAFVFYITVRPFSKKIYRKIIWYLAALAYLQMAFVADWWSGLELKLYMNKDDFNNYFGKEHALLIANHSYDIDWLPVFAICGRLKLLGNIRVVIKESLKYIPVIGWGFFLNEFIMLHREYSKDKKIIKEAIEMISNYPYPIWLMIYPEGTWFTENTHKKSQKFAEERGLPQLNYHLQPRTKGFVTIRTAMEGKIPAVYNIQTIFKETDVKATTFDVLAGHRMSANVYVERIAENKIPVDEEEQEMFLRNMFQVKDKIRDSYEKTEDLFQLSNVKQEHCIKIERPFYLVVTYLIMSLTVHLALIYLLTHLLITGSTGWFLFIVSIVLLSLLLLTYSARQTKIDR